MLDLYSAMYCYRALMMKKYKKTRGTCFTPLGSFLYCCIKYDAPGVAENLTE